MRINKSYLKYVVLLLLFACTTKNNDNSVSSSGAVIVNLTHDRSKDISIFDFCTSVEIVQLEDRPEAIIAEENILCKAFGDTSFFLLGNEDKLLREYDYEGKLLKLADKRGRGPGEFSMASDMIINKFSNTIDILNPTGIIYQYSLTDFSWVNTIDFSSNVNSVHYFAATSPAEYVLYSMFQEPFLLTYSTETGTTASIDAPAPPEWLSGTAFCGGGSPFFNNSHLNYVVKYDGTIYYWDGRQMQLAHSWDLGKNQFSPDLIEPNKEYFYYKELLNKTSRKYGTTFNRTFENGRFVVQNFRYRSWINLNTLLYDKVSNSVNWFSKTKEGVHFIVGNPCGGRICALMNSELRDLFVNEKILHDPASLNTYKRLSDDSNAILIIYTLKNE